MDEYKTINEFLTDGGIFTNNQFIGKFERDVCDLCLNLGLKPKVCKNLETKKIKIKYPCSVMSTIISQN